ncbi:hypothetical protein [Nocardioides aurantiacus]|uniref:Uncharacterized protein n=1 Tax=Nocardioides aurantiacus TaxID=86796 RepID=A0A3N2CUG4_9ACTN|nr:hypothetical protein [Nocardioides aurantiacus]ROR91048.1 hypothetical protein EDD33_1908 [Nocardioides aurantiacus]
MESETDPDAAWWGPYSQAVRRAAPPTVDIDSHAQAELWLQIDAAVLRPKAQRFGWRTVAAGVVAALTLGGVGTAAAAVWSAHTGRQAADAEGIELGGPGERLDPAAPDFATVLETTTADIRFPDQQSRDRALAWETDDLSSDPQPALVSTGAVRLWTSGHALCAWSNTWAAALRRNDDLGASRAAAVILGARTWSSIRDTDPDLSGESEFAWLPRLERAVRTSDPNAARTALVANSSCLPGLAPELGLGPS